MFQPRGTHCHTRLIDLAPDYPFPQTSALFGEFDQVARPILSFYGVQTFQDQRRGLPSTCFAVRYLHCRSLGE